MNIKEDILSFIEANDFDDFTKIRYIYLYVCDLFSYDARFVFGTHHLKDQIYHKEIVIQSVEEYEIACYTYAKVLVDLLSLFHIDAEVVREDTDGFSHAFVIVRHQGKILKLDPTKRHDTTRVKMHISTLNFESVDKEPGFSEQVAEADQQISAKSKYNNSFDIFLNNDAFTVLFDYLDEKASQNNYSSEELFFKKMKAIMDMINTRSNFSRYDDADYFLGFLLKKYRMNGKGIQVKPAVFFRKDDPDMKDIINLVLVEYQPLSPFFYILEKVDNQYQLREIEVDEVQEKLNDYTNWSVEYYFQNIVDQLLGRGMQ